MAQYRVYFCIAGCEHIYHIPGNYSIIPCFFFEKLDLLPVDIIISSQIEVGDFVRSDPNNLSCATINLGFYLTVFLTMHFMYAQQ